MLYVRESDVMAAATDEYGYVQIHGDGQFGAIPYKTLEEALTGLNKLVDWRKGDWLAKDWDYKERQEENNGSQRVFFYRDDFGVYYHRTFDIIKVEKVSNFG